VPLEPASLSNTHSSEQSKGQASEKYLKIIMKAVKMRNPVPAFFHALPVAKPI